MVRFQFESLPERRIFAGGGGLLDEQDRVEVLRDRRGRAPHTEALLTVVEHLLIHARLVANAAHLEPLERRTFEIEIEFLRALRLAVQFHLEVVEPRGPAAREELPRSEEHT